MYFKQNRYLDVRNNTRLRDPIKKSMYCLLAKSTGYAERSTHERIDMKTRTENEIMALILGLAEADDRIRVVVMNGSRVNPNVARDPFQDYDIATFVTDVEPFRNEGYVVPYFGEGSCRF